MYRGGALAGGRNWQGQTVRFGQGVDDADAAGREGRADADGDDPADGGGTFHH